MSLENPSKNTSKFDIWWNSPKVKRFSGAAYSLGASIVIVGALFKLMHWPGAGLMLSIGMFTEAILFALGIFDTPHKEYEWDKVFAFDEEQEKSVGKRAGGVASGATQTIAASPVLADAEMKSLSEGIKNLSETAGQLSSLSGAIGSTKEFAKNIESASDVAAKFATAQESLNNATGSLFNSYESLNSNMNSVVNNTTQYAEKVVEINKNLSSINSIYELQLKNIKDQSDAIAQQAQQTNKANAGLNEIIADQQKIISSTKAAVEETNKYKEGSAQLANQITELNKVYGNMLNALN